MRSCNGCAFGMYGSVVAILMASGAAWAAGPRTFGSSTGVPMNPAVGGVNPAVGGVNPAVGQTSSPNPVYSRSGAPRIYSSMRSTSSSPVMQGTVRGSSVGSPSGTGGAGRVISGPVSSSVTSVGSAIGSPRAIATIPRTSLRNGAVALNGTNVRSRVHIGLGAVPAPAVCPGGSAIRTANPIFTSSSPIITPGSPIITNVRPVIANPSAPQVPINATSPVVNPWPTVPRRPGCGGHVCRPRCGHGGCFGFVPVCSPVFFTPIVPYYRDTYVVREQPVQQFIFVDRQPEPPAPPAVAEQGPPVEPREAGRQVAAPRDAEPEPARGVARLPEELLQELMIEGTELFHRGDYHEAAKRFFRVTMADRLNVDATLAYAVARFATGDYQVSSLAVRRGVRRFPEVVDSAFDIRARYGEPEDFENHLARLEEFVRQNPDDVDAWVVLGFVRHFSGQRELAAQTFERLRERSPSDAVLADIFLNAKPLPAPAQPDDQGGATSPATTGEAPLPGGSDVQDEAEALITIE